MAGTVTVNEKFGTNLRKITFGWTSNGTGDASGTSTVNSYKGYIKRLVTAPGAGGSAPTDDYDVRVTDADGVDVLNAQGLNRDTANIEQVAETNLGIVFDSTLQLIVSNAGDTKSGTVQIYVEPVV